MPRHAQGARRLEAEGANVVEPFDDGDEAGGARLFRRLADPSQPECKGRIDYVPA
jgi:hypothetical protein